MQRRPAIRFASRIPPWIFFLLLLAGAWPVAPARGEDLAPFRLQLKWQHQFQFAGYYAAVEQGYYREAGLRVELLEARPGVDPVDVVLAGEADAGVGTSELVLRRAKGDPVVVLGVVYQHSPLVLLALRSPGFDSLHGLVGKRVMIEPLSAELFAYLRNEGIDPAMVELVEHSFGVQELLDGTVDAISAYSTDEPFLLGSAGAETLKFTPRAGGIDFYGDNLFTTEGWIDRRPELVEAFAEASWKGWEYAVAHPEEMVDLILRRYGDRKSREHLLFEARRTIALMRPDLVPVGYMYPGRWRHITETYADFDMVARNFSLEGFLYDPDPAVDRTAVYWTLAGLGVFALAALGWAVPVTRLNRKLRAARDEAEAANLAKGRYIAFLTHEIRSPLSALLGYLDVLEEEEITKSQRESLGTVQRLGRNLLGIVNDVLNFSRLEAGRWRLEEQSFPVPDLFGEVVTLFLPSARVKGVELRCEVDPSVPPVLRADAGCLRQIVTNLVANAVKFTDAGRIDVHVSASRAGPEGEQTLLTIRVADTGIGIPPDTVGHLFEPYAQGDPAIARRYGGSGLGLAIVDQLVHAMGGDVEVKSEAGRGSAFTVRVPVKTLDAGAPAGGASGEPRRPQTAEGQGGRA